MTEEHMGTPRPEPITLDFIDYSRLVKRAIDSEAEVKRLRKAIEEAHLSLDKSNHFLDDSLDYIGLQAYCVQSLAEANNILKIALEGKAIGLKPTEKCKDWKPQ